jgi:hypothetical protein
MAAVDDVAMNGNEVINQVKRKRSVRQFHSCCSVIVRNISDAVDEELKDNKLANGLHKGVARKLYYSGLHRRTFYKLLNADPDELDEEDLRMYHPMITRI